MGNCFRGAKPKSNKPLQNDPDKMQQRQAISQQDSTTLKLKTTQDKLLLQKRNLQKNSVKAEQEARLYVEKKQRDRAFFSLKRKKLYDTYLEETETQLTLIQKSIIEVETAQVTAQMVDALKNTNELLKQIDVTNNLENLVADIKDRDMQQQEFNKIFDQNQIEDDTVETLFRQFEAEVAGTSLDLNSVKLQSGVAKVDYYSNSKADIDVDSPIKNRPRVMNSSTGEGVKLKEFHEVNNDMQASQMKNSTSSMNQSNKMGKSINKNEQADEEDSELGAQLAALAN